MNHRLGIVDIVEINTTVRKATALALNWSWQVRVSWYKYATLIYPCLLTITSFPMSGGEARVSGSMYTRTSPPDFPSIGEVWGFVHDLVDSSLDLHKISLQIRIIG